MSSLNCWSVCLSVPLAVSGCWLAVFAYTQTASKGAPSSVGEFNYDSQARKLHFKDDELHVNKTDHLEMLIFFDEVIHPLSSLITMSASEMFNQSISVW